MSLTCYRNPSLWIQELPRAFLMKYTFLQYHLPKKVHTAKRQRLEPHNL